MKKKKNKKWTHPRHRRVTALLDFLLRRYVTKKYSIDISEFKEAKERPHLVLMNHQTAYDQFFVGLAFKGVPVYYVASEDIFTIGVVSKVIKYLVNPIPIKKQSADIRAVLTCMKVAKEGGTIALAPEGNRTFSGRTGYFNPAIAPLCKKLALPIALFRIEGGYGVHPRFSDVVRKGKMRAFVSRVLEPSEYSSLTDEELCELIRRELYVDETKDNSEFHSQRRAEYLERLLYVCPKCRTFSEFHSEGNTVSCKSCGLSAEYMPDKTLRFDGDGFGFKYIADWYDYQEGYVNSINPSGLTEEPIFTDTANVFSVVPYKKKKRISKNSMIKLYGDRLEIGDKILPFSHVSVITVLGKNKLNVYYEDKVFQLKSHKRFNAVKYMNIFYRYKNIAKGEEENGFLGL